MHMARLADPSRMKYALKSLTQELEPQIMAAKEGILNWMIDQENSAEVPNKAKLEKIVQGLKKKYTIQAPKTKDEAFKPIPKNVKTVIDDITEAIKFISI